MNSSKKLGELKRLGLSRKNQCYPGYFNIGDFHDGGYESEFVSPYTNTAGNIHSPIMILLQDWASADKLSGVFDKESAKLGYNPSLPTNKNLSLLLKSTFDLKLSEVFVTNVFPYVKPGKMSASIPQRDLNTAFKDFCLPQINILAPDLVICCGKPAFESVKKYFCPAYESKSKVNDYFKVDKTIYYYQRHPSPVSINRNGGIKRAVDDWGQMKNFWEKVKKQK